MSKISSFLCRTVMDQLKPKAQVSMRICRVAWWAYPNIYSQKSRELFFPSPIEVILSAISNSLWSQQNARIFVVLDRMVNKATSFSQSHTLIIKLINVYLIGRKCGMIFLSHSASVMTNLPDWTKMWLDIVKPISERKDPKQKFPIPIIITYANKMAENWLLKLKIRGLFLKVPNLFGPISGATLRIYIFATPRF